MPLLVPLDSPLRNPPADAPPVHKVGCDAVRYAFDATHLSWIRLLQNLASVMRQFEAGDRSMGEQATYALVDAWSVVDNLWRVHQVVNKLPYFKKAPELRALLKQIVKIKESRNGLQHIDGEFQNCASSGIPLWGSLGWVWTPDGDPVVQGKIFGLWAGAMRSGGRVPLINPFGQRLTRPIGLVTVSAFGETANLSEYMRIAVEIGRRVDAALRQNASGVQAGGGADVIFSADFTVGAPASGTPAPSTDVTTDLA